MHTCSSIIISAAANYATQLKLGSDMNEAELQKKKPSFSVQQEDEIGVQSAMPTPSPTQHSNSRSLRMI